MQYLSDYPDTEEIVFCLDNDTAGNKATEEITRQLKEQFEDKYEVKIDRPEMKDFNDVLAYISANKDENNQSSRD